LVGALPAYFAGLWIAMKMAPGLFTMTARAIRPDNTLLVLIVIAAPLYAVLSSLIPILIGITQDPARMLRND